MNGLTPEQMDLLFQWFYEQRQEDKRKRDKAGRLGHEGDYQWHDSRQYVLGEVQRKIKKLTKEAKP